MYNAHTVTAWLIGVGWGKGGVVDSHIAVISSVG